MIDNNSTKSVTNDTPKTNGDPAREDLTPRAQPTAARITDAHDEEKQIKEDTVICSFCGLEKWT